MKLLRKCVNYSRRVPRLTCLWKSKWVGGPRLELLRKCKQFRVIFLKHNTARETTNINSAQHSPTKMLMIKTDLSSSSSASVSSQKILLNTLGSLMHSSFKSFSVLALFIENFVKICEFCEYLKALLIFVESINCHIRRSC